MTAAKKVKEPIQDFMGTTEVREPTPEVREPTPEVKEVEKKPFVFRGGDLDLAGRHIAEYHVFVPDGVTLEDIKSTSWAHIAYRLQPMAHIYVTSESNKFAALLRVMKCSKTDAVTEVIWEREFSKANEAVNDRFEVQWVNNKEKFGIKRLEDKVWVQKGLSTVEEANQALVNEMQK